MDKTAIVVLAAGKSTRMQSPKQLLNINGNYLLDIILEKVKQLQNHDIYCVLGAHADSILKKIKSTDIAFIQNPFFEKGLSSSIKAAIDFFEEKELNYSHLFIVLGDQPEISVDYLEELLLLSKKYQQKIIATKYPTNFGVPAIFPKNTFKELKAIEGDKGAKELLNSNKDSVILPKFAVNLLDLDTQNDYQNYFNSIQKL